MRQALLTVTYRLTGDPAAFRNNMEDAAAAIAETRGLLWKIWGLDLDRRRGLSVYLFDGEHAANMFAEGPIIKSLRQHPDVAEVSLDHAPVDRNLSLLSGAGQALSEPVHPTEHTA